MNLSLLDVGGEDSCPFHNLLYMGIAEKADGQTLWMQQNLIML